ncbi:MAG: hypothetical protein A2600_03900 [Candidatus Lambdaproteobacteria bacterium RIFOXYD1_FULL_56_27]|uniref:Phosphatidylethanolamine-binding protein n=1 Tax=Candidatus Lambdaproteobacteria bacterium RIFOXYD2_FULL_56_26 TaxID=1817773 RepID=A0A1F6H3F6_9PROT|nr:MAG: hypothetical protein A2426_01700 [Candidatus Lambdaproteobacteria bacterium RIFOXYC1_FULL_56_13]OGH04902.1 MAG: hypothetical protein A2557_07965 [Candidatus Lambdaproteobacteria bacterium RIFOXYD2_FULL_56_26]OGH09367.1 MAG: hypothetical protein A2600_03900 [Candidatus Lambdaproteobacteria bacterium RIFOXYD1_FULL_56_27]
MPLSLSTPSFPASGKIPKKFTCDGANLSPELVWTGVPAEAKTLALVMEDPDTPDPAAPKRVFVHWVMYNLPANSKGIVEGIKYFPAPMGVGLNDRGGLGYTGPCPPIGNHRYFFRIYALNRILPPLFEPTKMALLEAMETHILDQAQLMGTYQR